MIPWSWISSIKVCLVVIVFICSSYASVHQEIDNLIVGELIFMTGYFWVKHVHFSSRIDKRKLMVGDKN